jgi:hypothetical protein
MAGFMDDDPCATVQAEIRHLAEFDVNLAIPESAEVKGICSPSKNVRLGGGRIGGPGRDGSASVNRTERIVHVDEVDACIEVKAE